VTSNALQELRFGSGKNYVEDGIEIRELVFSHDFLELSKNAFIGKV